MIRSLTRNIFLVTFYLLLLTVISRYVWAVCSDTYCLDPNRLDLILDIDSYNDGHITDLFALLKHRIAAQPFNLFATLIFFCAILHTFFAHYFSALAHRLRDKNRAQGIVPADSFIVGLLRFMGEIEVIFGLWVIPLFLLMSYRFNWLTAIHYVNEIEFLEPMFVVVIMAIASSGPIIKIAEDCIKIIAKLGKQSIHIWWWSLMTIGPLTGSLITEPGAMTITALLLAKQFYSLRPSARLSYGTLGLLFVNVSVGGVFTNFSAPAVLMVAKSWGWTTSFMAIHFGWKALLGILISNALYYFFFRQEFKELEKRRLAKGLNLKEELDDNKMPLWISMVHVCFLAWTVVHSHYPPIFVGGFLLFLGFYQATLYYQKKIELRSAILVGFFLGGLVVHGNLQAWWIAPVLQKTSAEVMLVLSSVLTAFNDNAQITFLTTLIPNFDEGLKYAVVAGAVTGGGLTVIANAPNPSGQAILGKYFEDGISAVNLFLAALIPTIIMGIIFYFFSPILT